MEGGTRMLKSAALGTLGAAGIAAALLLAPAVSAEPDAPVDPIGPALVVEAAPATPPVPAAAPAADPLAPPPADAAEISLTPPDGVPHLITPENLPPGATQAPTRTGSGTRGYLKDIWEAMRSGEVSTAEALMLIAQRPMNGTALKDMTPQQSATPTPGAVVVPEGVSPAPDAALPAPSAEAVPAAEVPLSEVPLSEVPLPEVIPAADEPVLVAPVTP